MGEKEMYANRGFSSRAGFGSSHARLITDFIVGFIDAQCPLGSVLGAEVEATARFLALFRGKSRPVLPTQVQGL